MTRFRTLRNDPWTKLLSVVLASLVWYVTNVRERDAERLVDLPVVIRRVPRNLVVTEWPLDRAIVTVRGPGPLLDGVDERRSRLVVSLAGLEPGETLVDLKGARIEPELPSSLTLVRTQPGRVTVVARPVKRRNLPVRPMTVGKVAEGFRLAQVVADPERVDVTGPAEEIARLEEVVTAPIRIDGATANVSQRAFVEWAGDFVTFVPDRVTVNVEVEEVLVTRRIDDVAITVQGAEAFRLDPPKVSLTLRAPASILDGFALEPGSVTVDATGLAPGEHQVAVTIVLPNDIEVVTRRPEVHRLIITAGQ